MIAQGGCRWTCVAIEDAVLFSRNSVRWYRDIEPRIDSFNRLLGRHFREHDCSTAQPSDTQQDRVLALCLAAAMAETGDL